MRRVLSNAAAAVCAAVMMMQSVPVYAQTPQQQAQTRQQETESIITFDAAIPAEVRIKLLQAYKKVPERLKLRMRNSGARVHIYNTADGTLDPKTVGITVVNSDGTASAKGSYQLYGLTSIQSVVGGYYDFATKGYVNSSIPTTSSTISVSVNSQDLTSVSRACESFVHEIGHWANDLGYTADVQPNTWYEQNFGVPYEVSYTPVDYNKLSQDWNKIYTDEVTGIQSIGYNGLCASNMDEAFAQGFADYYIHTKEMQKKAPEAYQYMQNFTKQLNW